VDAITITRYLLEGFTITDAAYWQRCETCCEWQRVLVPNLTPEEWRQLQESGRRTVVLEALPLDTVLRFQDDQEGAYSPEGWWTPAPVPYLLIQDLWQERRIEMARRESLTQNLTAWFVKEILGREIAPSDWKIIGAHAKSLLADYELADICGCLEAARDGLPDLELPDDFQVSYMTVIRRFEPPLIERWRQYKLDEPPSWMAGTHREWVERTTRTYEELDPMLRAEELRSAAEPAKARRRRSPKPVAPRLLPELHEGEHLPGAHQEGSDLRQ